MRKRIWIPIVVGVTFVSLGVWGVKPLLRRVLRDEASQRGVDVATRDLSFSLLSSSLELRQVRARLQGVDGLEVEFDTVRVALSWSSPRVRAVEVEGGRVLVQGSPEDVLARLQRFRERLRATSRDPGENDEINLGGGTRRERLRAVEVRWEGAFEGAPPQIFEGLHFERASGEIRLGLERAHVDRGRIQVRVEKPELEWSRQEGEWSLTRARALELEARVLPAPSASSPVRVVDRVVPSTPAPDQPEVTEPGLLDRVALNPARVTQLRAVLGLLRQRVAPRLPESSEIERLVLSLEDPAARLHVGPHKLVVSKNTERVAVQLLPSGEAQETPLALSVNLPLTESSPVVLQLEGGPIALSTLGVKEGDLGLRGVATSRLALSVRGELAADASSLLVEGSARARDLTIEQARLAPEPVRVAEIQGSGRVEVAVNGGRMKLEAGELRLGEARFLGELEFERGEDFASLGLSVRAPLVSCQALMDSAPRGLLGLVGAMRYEGTFSLDAAVRADTRALDKMSVHWDFKNGCKIRSVPALLDPERFRAAFRREILDAAGTPREADFGPQSGNWAPYSQISPYLEKALLVTEDGRFFRHQGFDDRAIESSIRDNTRAGKFVRGASTLSMQLAKNLYLSRDKNLSRKLQEAALTLLLEQSFDKRGLLELYANVVEFGPGIYGVSRAAEYYFKTTPDQLSIAQCFFLASILPAPTRNYFAANGQLHESRHNYLQQLFRIARKRESLSEAELELAQSERLVFGQSATTEASTAPSEVQPIDSTSLGDTGEAPLGAPRSPGSHPEERK